MALRAKIGSFATPLSTGAYPVTGVGFQPKAVIFVTSASSADAFTSAFHQKYGIADGTRQFTMSYTTNDNVSPTQGQTCYEDDAIMRYQALTGAVPSTQVRAAVTSLDSDGFTLNFTSAAASVYCIWIALGGDISARVDSVQITTSDTSKVVTGVGFVPTAVLFFPQHRSSGDEIGAGANAFDMALAGGWSDGIRHGMWRLWSEDAVTASNTESYQLKTRVFSQTDETSATDYDASLNSLDGDGFTLTVHTPPPALATRRVPYLALGGVASYAGFLAQPSSTGTQTIDGLGFRPALVLTASTHRPSTTAVEDGASIWFGGTDGTTSSGAWAGDTDAQNPTVTACRADTDNLILLATPDATAANSTINAAATLGAFTDDGFSLTWTTVDSTAREVLFLALGDATEVRPEFGDSFGPLIWYEWECSDGTTRIWGPVDLPDPSTYYGGYKAPKVLTAGRIVRALSDEQGEYQGQTFDVTVKDIDRDVRTLLGRTDERRHFLNTRIVARMISQDDWRAKRTPRTVAIGLVRNYRLH